MKGKELIKLIEDMGALEKEVVLSHVENSEMHGQFEYFGEIYGVHFDTFKSRFNERLDGKEVLVIK